MTARTTTKVRCPVCDALPGRPCCDERGRVVHPHWLRTEIARQLEAVAS